MFRPSLPATTEWPGANPKSLPAPGAQRSLAQLHCPVHLPMASVCPSAKGVGQGDGLSSAGALWGPLGIEPRQHEQVVRRGLQEEPRGPDSRAPTWHLLLGAASIGSQPWAGAVLSGGRWGFLADPSCPWPPTPNPGSCLEAAGPGQLRARWRLDWSLVSSWGPIL